MQRILGIQCRGSSGQLHIVEAAGYAVPVLRIRHGNGRVLQAVGDDAGDSIIADGTVFISHRAEVSSAEIQQALAGRTVRGGQSLQCLDIGFAQLDIVQPFDLEGTAGIDLGLDRVEVLQFARTVKDDVLAQRGGAEVLDDDGPCPFIYQFFVDGEAGGSIGTTNGEGLFLDLHIFGYQVAALDSNGSSGVHMEFTRHRYSASARDGKRVRDAGDTGSRGGRTEKAFGIIRTALS